AWIRNVVSALPASTSTVATPDSSVVALVSASVEPFGSKLPPGSSTMEKLTGFLLDGRPLPVSTKRADPTAPGRMVVITGSGTSTWSPSLVVGAGPLPAHPASSAHDASARAQSAPVDKVWMLLRWIARARGDKLSTLSKLGRFMPEFTHLHLHTQYSLLDGAIRLDQLFPKVLERGMKSVAMTDHGNLFGALDFYQRAKAHGVKPIFGCETYVAPDRLDKTERRSN